jgi:ParB family transcriptional regulator, chromosome partitioning protein
LKKFRHYCGACNTSASSAAKSSNNVIGKKQLESTEANNEVSLEAPDNLDDNNDIESNVLESESTDNNVIGKEDDKHSNPDLIIVEEVFDGLGLMTWESFANNRLPLLNLPSDILDALRLGAVEYTKAKAIAQIQDSVERIAFLEQAIAENWSLSEIKRYISENKTPNTEKTEANNYKERFTAATTKLRKSRIWSDPSKRFPGRKVA